MADAEGYRQANDAPASNEILRSIIFNKLPLLNSPGELVPNTLYYDARNCSVQAAEQTNFFGRDRIAFNNKDFGSTPSIHIPNVFFTNTCFVVAELEYKTASWVPLGVKPGEGPTPGTLDQFNSYFHMPHGWGFHMIDNIVYYLGSSSVANIQISGVANMIYHLASCETLSKKDSMLTGAGRMLNATFNEREGAFFGQSETTEIAGPVNDTYLFRNLFATGVSYDGDAAKFNVVNELDPALALAVIPIRLPFSSMCALEKRISFDTKLLQQPIQITLGLKSADKIMSFSPNTLANTGPLTTGLRSLTFQSWQQGLSDQSLSLRNELLANPRFSIGVPFQYVQDMSFNVQPEQNGEYFVNITSMLNADLTTIQLALRWDQDVKASNSTRFAPFQFIRMSNLRILLNGQRLHSYDNDSYRSVYLAQAISEGWATLVTAPPTERKKDQPKVRHNSRHVPVAVYEINFSRLRAVAMEAHMMNTPRFTNQTMQIAFTLDLDTPNFSPSQRGLSPNLVLLTSYYYNAVFMVGQDGGQSKLVTA